MSLLKLPYAFLKDIYINRYVIYQLTKRDYKNRYIGSFLGFIWTIIQPFVMIFVLWLVFVKGFKSGPINGVPFIAYMALGTILWDFFASSFISATNVFQEYSYLVKKVNFRIAILPIVKLLSALLTHLITLAIVIVIILVSGVTFSLHWFGVLFYLPGLFLFLLGLSWIASSLQVFVKDVVQIVTVILQFGFWITPIFWDFKMVPEHLQIWFKLNPIFYIISGYRKSFLYHEPFWNFGLWDLYFWIGSLTVLLISVILFRKLRPHFSDVL